MSLDDRPLAQSVDSDFLYRLVQSRTGTVLIAEDDPGQRVILARILRKQGFEVQEAANGEEALDWLAGHAEECDAVLLDIMMPKLDGGQTLRALRATPEGVGLPVIMLTVLGDMAHVVEYLRMGASDYLHKPYSPDELLARVAAHVRVRQLQRVIRAVVAQNVQQVIAYGLADALHNRLLALTGYLCLWQQRSLTSLSVADPDRPKVQQLADKVNTTLMSLHSAVDELLDYTHGTANYRLQEVSIEQVLFDLVEDYRDFVQFSFRNVTGAPLVGGDPDKLRRCFRELVCNSIDAGTTRIQISLRHQEDQMLAVEMADNGKGMDRELVDIATLPFFTTRGTVQTGAMGLWSTRQYLRSLGGEMQVQKRQPEGTAVTVYLPVYVAPADMRPPIEAGQAE